MKLLAVDKEFNVEIEPHCYEIEEFKNVIKRIKKTRGDTDGRKKELAKKELAYIYHMASNDSIYANFSERDRHFNLLNDVFADSSYKIDAEVKLAIEKYKELNITPALKLIVTLTETLHKTDKIIKAIIEQLEENLENNTHKQQYVKMGNAVKTGVQITVDDINCLMDVGKRVPLMLTELEGLQKKVEKEKEEKASRIKGKLEVSNRER
jgi:hypothetical protein